MNRTIFNAALELFPLSNNITGSITDGVSMSSCVQVFSRSLVHGPNTCRIKFILQSKLTTEMSQSLYLSWLTVDSWDWVVGPWKALTNPPIFSCLNLLMWLSVVYLKHLVIYWYSEEAKKKSKQRLAEVDIRTSLLVIYRFICLKTLKWTCPTVCLWIPKSR